MNVEKVFCSIFCVLKVRAIFRVDKLESFEGLEDISCPSKFTHSIVVIPFRIDTNEVLSTLICCYAVQLFEGMDKMVDVVL